MSCDRDGLHGMGSLNTTRIALVLKFKFVITSAFPMETIQFFIDYSVTIFRLRLLTYHGAERCDVQSGRVWDGFRRQRDSSLYTRPSGGFRTTVCN